MKKNIHIGSLIEQKVKEQGIRITDFAKSIHCNRSNVYSIFRRKSIDIDQLLLISKTLEYDFISEIYCNKKEATTCDIKRVLLLEVTDEKKNIELSNDKSLKIINSWIVKESSN